MKVAVIAFNNIRISPYVKIYTEWLQKKEIEYDLIYLDREGVVERLGASSVYPIPFCGGNKFFAFMRFTGAVKKILKRNKYDFLFVMPTFSAVLLSRFISKRYKGKYIVDIRDKTHEDNRFYFARERRAIENSAMNVISSKGYYSFLPKGEYVFSPNVSATSRVPEYKFTRKEDVPLSIAYVGCISRTALYKRLIEKVLKDDRFEVDLYGSEVLRPGVTSVADYVKTLGTNKVRFHGAYKPEEKAEIVKSIDILINIYGSDGMRVAMANKFYDSMYFKKPMISEAGSVMHKECGDFTFAFDIEDDAALDNLYEWYMNLDGEAYDRFADGYLEGAYADLDAFYAALEHAVFGAAGGEI